LGNRPELTGGGLIRSLGGWGQAKGLRKTGNRFKSDERILGESGFVEQVLSAANERMDRCYQLQARGFTFEMLVEKVAQWLEIEPEEVLRAGKQPLRVKARDPLCYFACDAVSDRGGRHVAHFIRAITEDRYFRVRRIPNFRQFMGHIYWLRAHSKITSHFVRRCIPSVCVAKTHNIEILLRFRALPAGRLTPQNCELIFS
jgi:hypothetical protein